MGAIVMMRIGTSMVIAHHGELVQGVFEDSTGNYRTGLVTIPYYKKCTKAMYREKNGRWFSCK